MTDDQAINNIGRVVFKRCGDTIDKGTVCTDPVTLRPAVLVNGYDNKFNVLLSLSDWTIDINHVTREILLRYDCSAELSREELFKRLQKYILENSK